MPGGGRRCGGGSPACGIGLCMPVGGPGLNGMAEEETRVWKWGE